MVRLFRTIFRLSHLQDLRDTSDRYLVKKTLKNTRKGKPIETYLYLFFYKTLLCVLFLLLSCLQPDLTNLLYFVDVVIAYTLQNYLNSILHYKSNNDLHPLLLRRSTSFVKLQNTLHIWLDFTKVRSSL